MQGVFEKIIDQLNKKKTYFQKFYETEGKTEHDEDLNKVTQLAFDDAIEVVKEVAVEYNNGWIPCSERLPEHCQQREEKTANCKNCKHLENLANKDGVIVGKWCEKISNSPDIGAVKDCEYFQEKPESEE